MGSGLTPLNHSKAFIGRLLIYGSNFVTHLLWTHSISRYCFQDQGHPSPFIIWL